MFERFPPSSHSHRTFGIASVGRLVCCLAVGGALAASPASQAARLELRLESGPGPYAPGETITVGLWMTDLGGDAAAGFQAFLTFDPGSLDLIGGLYTSVPFDLPIIPIAEGPGGTIDLAAGIDVEVGQPPSSADARLATLVFETLVPTCLPALDFRPTIPPTRITDPIGVPILPLQLVAFNESCPADLVPNGAVDFSDLTVLLANWNGACVGDLDGSGSVDFADLVELLSLWGPCP